MKSNLINQLNQIIETNAQVSNLNFIETAGAALMHSKMGKNDSWAKCETHWSNMPEKEQQVSMDELLYKMETLTCDLELTFSLEAIWQIQILSSLYLELNKNQITQIDDEQKYYNLTERCYRVPKDADAQNDCEALMLAINLQESEWLEAIKYAIERPLIYPNANVYELILGYQQKEFRYAAAENKTLEAPPQVLLDRSTLEDHFSSPFDFNLKTYLTEDWSQVIELETKESISLISWKQKREFYDNINHVYIFEKTIEPNIMQYLSSIDNSIIRIITKKNQTVEIKLQAQTK